MAEKYLQIIVVQDGLNVTWDQPFTQVVWLDVPRHLWKIKQHSVTNYE